MDISEAVLVVIRWFLRAFFVLYFLLAFLAAVPFFGAIFT